MPAFVAVWMVLMRPSWFGLPNAALRPPGKLSIQTTRHDTSRMARSKPWFSYTLWLFNIAMENGPFIDGLPIKNGDFPWLC